MLFLCIKKNLSLHIITKYSFYNPEWYSSTGHRPYVCSLEVTNLNFINLRATKKLHGH
jgi:hypothetical protein